MPEIIKYENTNKNRLFYFFIKTRLVIYVLFFITILIFNMLIIGNTNQKLDTSTAKFIDKNQLPPTQ